MARYKGEQFLVFLPGTDVLKALQVAGMILRDVEKVKWPDGISVTVSTGVASYPDDGEKLTELLKSLERALTWRLKSKQIPPLSRAL